MTLHLQLNDAYGNDAYRSDARKPPVSSTLDDDKSMSSHELSAFPCVDLCRLLVFLIARYSRICGDSIRSPASGLVKSKMERSSCIMFLIFICTINVILSSCCLLITSERYPVSFVVRMLRFASIPVKMLSPYLTFFCIQVAST